MRAALHEGGCDTSCGTGYPQHLLAAFEHGAVSLEDLQSGATNLMRQVFEVGLMDPPGRVPYSSYGPEQVDTPLHRQLAYEAALQGIVLLQVRAERRSNALTRHPEVACLELLQNNATSASLDGSGTPLLPLLRARLAGRHIAVIGPNANATQTLLSNFHGSNTLVGNQSVFAALARVGASAGFAATYAPGCVDGSGPDANASIACAGTWGFADALEAVRNSSLAVVVVGWCSDDCPSLSDAPIREAEGNDRPFTRWAGSGTVYEFRRFLLTPSCRSPLAVSRGSRRLSFRPWLPREFQL